MSVVFKFLTHAECSSVLTPAVVAALTFFFYSNRSRAST